jgi:hypothetical protein
MIYVASSWRNRYQPDVVQALVAAGHAVYDFRKDGFGWSSIDPNWKQWTRPAYAEALKHPLAEKGFKRDRDALVQADTCVLVLPAGRSAHLEAGCFVNKRLIIYMPEEQEPELMYKLAEKIVFSLPELVTCLGGATCNESGCQERATHLFYRGGKIRRLCAAHYNAKFKCLEPPDGEITLCDIRPTEKIDLSVEVP